MTCVALVCGILEEDKFPGRNTFPLLGRPMMAYPILAAQQARMVDHVFLTTDSDVLQSVATGLRVTMLLRPENLRGRSVPLVRVVTAALADVAAQLGREPEAVALLLCNAPTVTSGLIEHGVEILQRDASVDAVMSVSRHNEFHPAHALRVVDNGLLQPLLAQQPGTPQNDAYFPDALLWVIRSATLKAAAAEGANPHWLVDPKRHRVHPLIHEGYGDVDHVWQVPAIEQWLRREGFSEQRTPYDHASDAPLPVVTRTSVAMPSLDKGKILITTVPFGEGDRRPLEQLEIEGIDYTINPLRRRLTEAELADMIGETRVLIAGTEPITAKVMSRAPQLQLIARVGIGLDNVDLIAARERGILVTYTPDAPAPAVAELTLGLMLASLRSIAQADRSLRNGIWHRISGRRLADLTIGIIGAGRVGKRVIRHLSGFGPKILANDLLPDRDFGNLYGVQWVSKEDIYRQADIVSLHLPLTPQTRSLITGREIEMMAPGVVLINTSRGGMINEHDLAQALNAGHIGAAALDVFSQEPYAGELITQERCLFTCHMGSMSRDCRARMELEATAEAVRFVRGEPLALPVPEEEYVLRAEDPSKSIPKAGR